MFFKKWLLMGILLVSLALIFLPGCTTTTKTITTVIQPTATTGGLEFSIKDTSGNPLDGAKVVSQTQPDGQLKVTGITSNGNGIATLNDLKPGDYLFDISRYDYQGVSLKINVVVGQTSQVVLNLVKTAQTGTPSPTAN